jgi:chemotaxis protein CheZ
VGLGEHMQAQRNIFRIEAINCAARSAPTTRERSPAYDHIIAELKALRSLVQPREELNTRMIESYKAQIAEAQKLKAELDIIQEAIVRTKHEIATLHVTGFEGPEMARVTDELDAIVTGTETATETILASAEFIDQSASTLGALLKSEQDQALAHDIQDHVVRIFEACNFQDLTGQRITKVVATLKFIETHIVRMIEIWGGLEAFKDLAPEAMAERDGDKKLLNGPKLEEEAGHVSQDDIDALFN